MCHRYVARVGEQAGHVTQNRVAKQDYNLKEKKRHGCCGTFANKNVPSNCVNMDDLKGYC